MGYYLVDGEERFDDLESLCQYIFDPGGYDDDDALDEWINECYCDESCNIGGTEFSPAEIVKALDSYMYGELRSEWAESQSESDIDYYSHDLTCMRPGGCEYINNYRVEYFEDDEEDNEDEQDDEEDLIVKVLMDHFQKI